MAQIKVMKGDIFNLKKPVDMIVYANPKDTEEISFVCSKYPNSRYSMLLPGYELGDDNAMDFLDFYKKPIRKARELKMRTIAIEAVDMKDDALTLAFAAELKQILQEATLLYDISIVIVGRDRDICDIYEIAIFGEIRSAQVTMTDQLESNEVFIIPTKKKIMRWDKHYKELKKQESSSVFWKYYFTPGLKPGELFIINGREYAIFYYLINFDDKKLHPDAYKSGVVNAIKKALNSIEFMACHNVTVPILHFVKNKNKNRALVEMMLEAVCDFIEDKEINIKLYCPDEDIWDFVQEWFEAQERK